MARDIGADVSVARHIGVDVGFVAILRGEAADAVTKVHLAKLPDAVVTPGPDELTRERPPRSAKLVQIFVHNVVIVVGLHHASSHNKCEVSQGQVTSLPGRSGEVPASSG
jgi:hypothetical protein